MSRYPTKWADAFVRAFCTWIVALGWAAGMATAPAAAQRPAPPEQAVAIQDGGFTRNFAIARDEVYIAGDIERLPAPRPTARAIRDHADALAAARDEPAALVLYEVGVERSDATRRILSHQVVARLAKDADAAALAGTVDAVSFQTPDYARDYAVFYAEDALGTAFDLANRLRAHPDIRDANPVLRRLRFKRHIPNDPLFSDQWHLRNTGQDGATPGIDIRVTNVWALGYFGEDIIIGIVDDGLQYTHPDLTNNYVAAYSRNWNGPPGDQYDPAPETGGTWPDNHGTPCAGLAAAQGDNHEGISGVAPRAGLAGLRLIAGPIGDVDEAEALAHSNHAVHVKSNSWGPTDAVGNLEAPGPLTRAALEDGTTHGRNGLGTIFVWAGGNGLTFNDNANYDGYANSIHTLSVAAIEKDGGQAWYSEPGACHIVTAPGGDQDIVSTALMGQGDHSDNNNYTASFEGTSASTPLVAGVVALMLEANPALGWRDVQEILIATARQNDPGDGDWNTNAAGFTFNHKYGSGLVDADAAVNAALTWTNLGPQILHQMVQTNLNQAIPDYDPIGITRTFNVTTNMRAEHVTATVDIQHTYRGDLTITLISPSGMSSTLAETRSDSNNDYTGWTFMTARKWGESIQGEWELHIADLAAGDIGTLQSARLDFYGAGMDVSSNIPPVLAPIGDRSFMVDQPVALTITANDPIDHDAITLSASNLPPWAVFATTTAVGTVSQTLSGTPTATGTWMTTFHATDKDGTDSETITINVTPFIASNFVGVLDEGFDTGLPDGWSVTTNAHPDAYWRFDDPDDRGNLTGGSGTFAIADSDHAGSVDMDTSLETPPLDLITLSTVQLRFKTDFRYYSLGQDEIADVDISTNGAAGPWANVWRRTADYRGPQTETIDISGQAAGQRDVIIRFRYHNANWDWWWQVDDVEVFGYEIDSDGDGIPDAWELFYFGDLETADATSDYTGNGFSDYHAFLANTDPTDPNSLLRLEHQTAAPEEGFTIQWQSAPDRSYRVGRSTNLPHFTTIESGIPSTPPLNTYEDATATNSPVYYYRIELDL